MSKLRYYDSASVRKSEAPPKAAIYTEFLRTGRINRRASDWNPVEKRYLTHDEVAARTAKKLETAGDTTHSRINAFHPSIRFPKLLFQRTLKGSPHLGYCHVTAAKTQFAPLKDIKWSFYIANFYADIGDSEQFFERINLGYSRMYFAVAIDEGEEIGRMVINRTFRSDGLLFRTHDPKVALKNVLQLGARNEQLRKIIRSL